MGDSPRVASKVDGGEVVYSSPVSVYKKDTPETLSKRVLLVEHKIQALFLGKVYEGKINTVHRSEPLIKKEKEEFLRTAKETAIKKYSK